MPAMPGMTALRGHTADGKQHILACSMMPMNAKHIRLFIMHGR